MRRKLIEVISSADPAIRNLSLDTICADLNLSELLAETEELERFRGQTVVMSQNEVHPKARLKTGGVV